MSQKAYLIILKTGIYFSLLSFFLIFESLFFPYITSKQIYFNVLIEALFIVWLAFIIKYPSWRPKISLISVSLVGFFAVLTLSAVTGVDFNLSFWGDTERMLGVFHTLHFLAYYFILITVMKTWQDWRYFFTASVIAATLLVLYGWVKGISFSTFGNTAYLSAYAIFNFYFALIVFFREWSRYPKISDNWLVTLYLGAAAIIISSFSMTKTRGAYVGLGLSLLCMLAYATLTGVSRKIKFTGLGIIIILAGLVGLAFFKPDLPVIRDSNVLKTINQITPQTNTFQTRFIAWRAAWQDLPNHWLLGTGHGNFAITFDKYFDPNFYNYTRTEAYFDRAHNNIVEITSTAGALGLVAYLSIIATALYYVVRGRRRGEISRYDFILLTGLIVAYFVQNLAAFDSLASYISLMMMLGYIYWLSQAQSQAAYVKDGPWLARESAAWVGSGIVMVFIIYQYNVLPFKMMQDTIIGQIAFELDRPALAFDYYQKALSYNTPLDRDTRGNFAYFLTHESYRLADLNQEEKNKMFDYGIALMEQNIAYNPQDSLMRVEMAQLANVAARFNKNNTEVFYQYSNRSLESIDKAIAYSPGRVPTYIIKAQIYEVRNEINKAVETLAYAVDLNQDYYDGFCYIARYYFMSPDSEAAATQAMDRCLDLGGAVMLEPSSYVENLSGYYWGRRDWRRTLLLYERLSELNNSAEAQVGLAKLYLQNGQIDSALAAARRAMEMNPEKFGALADDFIQKVQAGNYQEFLPKDD